MVHNHGLVARYSMQIRGLFNDGRLQNRFHWKEIVKVKFALSIVQVV